jgi:hypothetical protein
MSDRRVEEKSRSDNYNHHRGPLNAADACLAGVVVHSMEQALAALVLAMHLAGRKD